MVAACAAVIVTVPAPFNVTRPVVDPTVANAVLLLVYVTAPVLALLAVTVNAALVTFLVVGGLTNARVGVALETVRVLLVTVPLVYCPVTAAWVALKLTSPTPVIFIQFPDVSMVATLGLKLVYVIAPLLLLVGRVDMANDASLYVFELATVNVVRVGATWPTLNAELTLLVR